MTDALQAAIEAASGNVSSTPLSRVQVIPYADLQVLNQPANLNQISNDLIPTLAILVGQGPVKPLLLRTDTIGNLKTTTTAATITTLTAPLPGGQVNASVQDSGSFYPGQITSLVSKDGSVGACTEVQVQAIPDNHTIVFSGTCNGHDFKIDDFVVGGGDTRVTQVVSPVPIGSIITLIPPGAPNPGDQQIGSVSTINGHKRFMVDAARSYDLQGFGGSHTGAASTVTFAAPGAGLMNIVAGVVFGLNSNTAGDFATCEIWLDAVGTGTQLLGTVLQIEPGSFAVTLPLLSLNIRGNANKPVIVRTVNGTVNSVVTCSAFGYLEG